MRDPAFTLVTTNGVTPTDSPSIETRAPCGSELRASVPTNDDVARFEGVAVTGAGTGERRIGTVDCGRVMVVSVGDGAILPAVPSGIGSARDARGDSGGDGDAALCSVGATRARSVGIRAAGARVGALGPITVHVENPPTSTPNAQDAAANFVSRAKLGFARDLAGIDAASRNVGRISSGRFGVGCASVVDSEGNSSVKSTGLGNDGARCGGVMASPRSNAYSFIEALDLGLFLTQPHSYLHVGELMSPNTRTGSK